MYRLQVLQADAGSYGDEMQPCRESQLPQDGQHIERLGTNEQHVCLVCCLLGGSGELKRIKPLQFRGLIPAAVKDDHIAGGDNPALGQTFDEHLPNVS